MRIGENVNNAFTKMVDVGVGTSDRKRPVNKKVYNIKIATMNSQTNNTVLPAITTGPCTLDGIKGHLTIQGLLTAYTTLIIYLQRAGFAAPVINAPDTSSQQPFSGMAEQNVIWHFTWPSHVSALELHVIPIDIKTKRKLQDGDKIMLSTRSNVDTSNMVTMDWSVFTKH